MLREPGSISSPSTGQLCPAAAWGQGWSAREPSGSPHCTSPPQSQRDANTERLISRLPRTWRLPPITFIFLCSSNPKHNLDLSVHCQSCLPDPAQAVGAPQSLSPTKGSASPLRTRIPPLSLPRSNHQLDGSNEEQMPHGSLHGKGDGDSTRHPSGNHYLL